MPTTDKPHDSRKISGEEKAYAERPLEKVFYFGSDKASDRAFFEKSEPLMIDSRLPRFNQAVLASIVLLSFVFQFFWTIPVWALFLLGGVVAGPPGNPVQALFRYSVLPRLGPPKSVEDPRPPRFAALLGFLFLAVSTAAYLGGFTRLAWGLALVVAALATVAAIFNLCVGCEIYVYLMKTRGAFSEPWRMEPSEAIRRDVSRGSAIEFPES